MTISFQLTFNLHTQHYFEKYFSDRATVAGVRIKIDQDTIYLKPVTAIERDLKPGRNGAIIGDVAFQPRTRGGQMLRITGHGADDLLAILARKASSKAPFFLLKKVRSQGWLTIEHYRDGDVPPKVQPHMRVWFPTPRGQGKLSARPITEPKSRQAPQQSRQAPRPVPQRARPEDDVRAALGPFVDTIRQARDIVDRHAAKRVSGRPPAEVSAARGVLDGFTALAFEMLPDLSAQPPIEPIQQAASLLSDFIRSHGSEASSTRAGVVPAASVPAASVMRERATIRGTAITARAGHDGEARTTPGPSRAATAKPGRRAEAPTARATRGVGTKTGRKPGRPLGSKNKPKDGAARPEMASTGRASTMTAPAKAKAARLPAASATRQQARSVRGRGTASLDLLEQPRPAPPASPPGKRRGRPPGSKNKPKSTEAVLADHHGGSPGSVTPMSPLPLISQPPLFPDRLSTATPAPEMLSEQMPSEQTLSEQTLREQMGTNTSLPPIRRIPEGKRGIVRPRVVPTIVLGGRTPAMAADAPPDPHALPEPRTEAESQPDVARWPDLDSEPEETTNLAAEPVMAEPSDAQTQDQPHLSDAAARHDRAMPDYPFYEAALAFYDADLPVADLPEAELPDTGLQDTRAAEADLPSETVVHELERVLEPDLIELPHVIDEGDDFIEIDEADQTLGQSADEPVEDVDDTLVDDEETDETQPAGGFVARKKKNTWRKRPHGGFQSVVRRRA